MPNDSDSSQDKKELVFHFSGFVDVTFISKGDISMAGLVSLLESNRDYIEDEIRFIIMKTISDPEIEIYPRIEFFEGSIEIMGIVAILISSMNLLSAISGTVDFFEKTSKTISFAVERSVRRTILQAGGRIREGSFKVDVITPNPYLLSRLSRSSISNQLPLIESLKIWQREQSRLIHLVIQNQNLILASVLNKEKDNQKLKFYIFGLLVVLLVVVVMLINYSS